jgi:hypothetical protein
MLKVMFDEKVLFFDHLKMIKLLIYLKFKIELLYGKLEQIFAQMFYMKKVYKNS